MKAQITKAGGEASSSKNGGKSRTCRLFREMGQKDAEEALGDLGELGFSSGASPGPNPDGSQWRC